MALKSRYSIILMTITMFNKFCIPHRINMTYTGRPNGPIMTIFIFHIPQPISLSYCIKNNNFNLEIKLGFNELRV